MEEKYFDTINEAPRANSSTVLSSLSKDARGIRLGSPSARRVFSSFGGAKSATVERGWDVRRPAEAEDRHSSTAQRPWSSAKEDKPTWCPGCGNFGIIRALKNALSKLRLTPKDAVLVYGIGCHGNMHNFLKTTAFSSLHGRVLPVAQGIKMVNPKLTVLGIAGDGDALGEGGNHLIHAARRNINLTYLIHDNRVYALTTGQTSPTSPLNFKTKSTPAGNFEVPVNPLSLSLTAGATFVARGFAGDIPHLTEIIVRAINHQGFSVVNILQPCVSFNPQNTYDWYKEHILSLEKTGYKPDNKIEAVKKSLDEEKLWVGIFYEETRKTGEEYLPPIRKITDLRDISSILEEFK